MNSVSCAQMTDQQRGFLTNQIAQGQNTLPSLRFKCSRKDRQGLMRARGFRVIMIHGFRSGMRKAMIITIIKIFFYSGKEEVGTGVYPVYTNALQENKPALYDM